ncbi:MAG: 4-hydroxythreonine-4-phosphate dehydrogenase PdxA, partial [Verrucomicrobiaceae bacterium]|nr:4-hydroxythreonine-4-phosphate dehydrogenase PdxA [Verrucomicrobiaceae bacterium]
MDAKPRIAVTMGDPSGVGPELCLRLLNDHQTSQRCTIITFGNSTILNRVAAQTGLKPPNCILEETVSGAELRNTKENCLLDLTTPDISEVNPGEISAASGHAASHFLDTAIEAALAGDVDAITTAPLNKQSLHLAGVAHPGHTEILAAKTGSKNFCMMQYSEEITATFATCHVGLSEVSALITTDRVLEVIKLTAEALKKLPDRPSRKIIVLGLNPHSGEGGLFGNKEEEKAIIPAIKAARNLGIEIEGPLPPDTAFIP